MTWERGALFQPCLGSIAVETDVVIDLETTANGPDCSPDAQWPNNRVLYCGHMVRGRDQKPILSDSLDKLFDDLQALHDQGRQIRLVGHNLKFDLKYLLRYRPDFKWPNLDYVCTMHRHYRITGHYSKFISLEDLAAANNIFYSKQLDLGAIIQSGVKMEDIPEEDLLPYLEDDVETTFKILLEQDRFDPELSSPLVLPLAHMELLGLPLDRAKAKSRMVDLVKLERDLENKMTLYIARRCCWNDGSTVKNGDIKVSAPRTLSFLLTGQPTTITQGKRTLIWKAANRPAMSATIIKRIWSVDPTHLGYPMPKATVDKLIKDGFCVSYLKDVLEYRATQKLMGTYVGPFLEQTQQHPTVHPTMHLCSTNTGRLSSANPNGQNMPPSARELFKSEHGKFIEIDFKQLEVVALAAITQDPKLIADVRACEDIHFNSGKKVMGWKTPADMTPTDRKLVKNVNFGLIYGGGAKGLSEQTGRSKNLIRDLMRSFYARYPGVEKWQAAFYTEVVDNLKPLDIKDGEQRYHSSVLLPISDRIFHFVESESPLWLRRKTGRKFSFKPTETKNYPVQGFAGGDIVMMALVLLHKFLWDQPAEIRMTVHDSILVDTKLPEPSIVMVMDQVCRIIESVYSLPFQLEFDTTTGTYWR